jgi:hypothetical protein
MHRLAATASHVVRVVRFCMPLIALCAGGRATARSLDLRGTVAGFPFWLGTTMYGNQWKVPVEGAGWWFDREHAG